MLKELAEVGTECGPICVADLLTRRRAFSMVWTGCRWKCMNKDEREKRLYKARNM